MGSFGHLNGIYYIFQRVVIILTMSVSIAMIMMIASGLSVPIRNMDPFSGFILFVILISIMFIVSVPLMMIRTEETEEEVFDFVLDEDSGSI